MDFEFFEQKDFERLKRDNFFCLRIHLRVNGVYIKRGRGISWAQGLVTALREELLWFSDDEERSVTKSQGYSHQQVQKFQIFFFSISLFKSLLLKRSSL